MASKSPTLAVKTLLVGTPYSEPGQLHHALNHESGAYQQSAGKRQLGNHQTAAELSDPKRGRSSALILEHLVRGWCESPAMPG